MPNAAKPGIRLHEITIAVLVAIFQKCGLLSLHFELVSFA